MARLSRLIIVVAALASPAAAQPILQPGAPGQASRTVSADQARPAPPVILAADIQFMLGMVHHHQQAVAMTALIAERSQDPAIRRAGERIASSQASEIGFMEDWLASHAGGEHAMHMAHAMDAPMPGMLSPAQMTALAQARGPAFDRLFLRGMIQHHQGALDMVLALNAQPGSTQEANLSQFLINVYADQNGEIGRMEKMLGDR